MSTQPQQRVVRDYLDDLRNATRDLPRERRRELVAEIEDHITEALLPTSSEADARQVLDRLGAPEEIAAVEQERLGMDAPGGGTMERLTIALLLIGFIATPIGWLVGVVMLWTSQAWTVRDKLIGTLVVPGGLGLAFVALALPLSVTGQTCTGGSLEPPSSPPRTQTVSTCTGGLSTLQTAAFIAAELLLIAAPIFTAFYLARRQRRPLRTG
jgi:uncharacterized membrane protein